MADQENIVELGGKDNLTPILEAGQRGVKKLGKELLEFTKVTKTFNKEGKDSRAVLTGVTKDGYGLKVVVDKTVKGYRVFSQELTQATVNLKKQSQAQAQESKLLEKKSNEISKLKDQLKSITQAQKDMANAQLLARDATTKFIGILQSIERVAAFFILRRALYSVVTGIQNAIQNLQELHSSISEIQTITQSSATSTQMWSDSLLKISNAWNLDLVDTAAAAYEAASNQMGETVSEIESFMVTVGEFSKITRSTAMNSMNLLSSAINAFGMSSSDAARVAAILFKTIDLGRVTATELANTFGRSAVLANQLGVSLEELGAMMSVITIQGVKANEAQTLLRGIFMKLAKPTDDMKKLFEKLGVSSGEQLIQTYGLSKAFRILYDETKGTNTELAELFGNIRPTMGMSALLAQLDRYNDVLNEIKNSSKGAYEAAKQYQFTTVGEEYAKAVNQIKNTFTTEFSYAFISGLMDITRGFNTVKTTATGVKVEMSGLAVIIDRLSRYLVVGGIISVGIKSLRVLTVSWTTAIEAAEKAILANKIANGLILADLTEQNKQLKMAEIHSKAVGQVWKSIGVTAVWMLAVTAISVAISKMIEYSAETKAAREETIKLGVELLKLNTEKASMEPFVKAMEDFEASTKTLNESIATFRGNWSGAINFSKDKVKELEETVKNLATQLEDIFKDVGTNISDMFSYITSDIARLQKEIENIQNSIKEINSKTKSTMDKMYERTLSSDKDRLTWTGVKQQRAVGEFNTATNVDEAKKAIDTIIDLEYDKIDLEQSMYDDYVNQQKRYDEDLKNIRKSIDTEQKRIDRAKAKGTDIDYDSLNELKAELAALVKPTPVSKPITAGHYAYAQQAEANFEAYARQIEKQKQDEITANNGILAGIRQMRDAWVNNLDLPESVRDSLASINLEIGDEKSARMQGLIQSYTSGGIDALTKQLLPKDFDDIFAEYIKNKTDLDANLAMIQTADLLQQLVDIQQSLLDYQKGVKTTAEKAKTDYGEAVKREQDLREQNANMGRQLMKSRFRAVEWTEGTQASLGKPGEASKMIQYAPGIMAEKISLLLDRFQYLTDEEKLANKDTLINAITEYSAVAANFTRVLEKEFPTRDQMPTQESAKLAAINNYKKSLNEYVKSLDAIPEAQKLFIQAQEDLKIKTDEATTAQGTFNTNLSEFIPLLKEGGTISAELINQLKQALEDFKNNTPGAKAPGHYLGGRIYASKGMFVPRSTDTVPAMLTPGEFVMNKSAAKQFAGRLVPMNFGQQNLPSNNSSVNVGDISVTMNNAGNNLSPRDVAYAIRNEVRRGMMK